MPPHTSPRRRNSTLTTALTIIPCVLAISLFTAIQHLYHTRRRLTSTPVSHPVLFFRDPKHCLSHPANRVFNVRADRNILASAPLAHCFFEAELVESECVFVTKVDRRRMRDVLAWMMEVKKGCDKTTGVKSPLPWGSEAGQAITVEREWARLCAKGLRKFGGRLWSGYNEKRTKGNGYGGRRGSWWDEEWEEQRDDNEDGWFEVWEGVVQNRCAGWVVEPQHTGIVSLEDDDEEPFTWVNIQRANMRVFDGEWMPRGRRDSLYRVF
ncbi:hypothetical protein BDD12DRAFT_901978 [Trichophaea hybrida]|nr:hypothetical protein BDD12DRAFT_901978 [Trichophaea hybrida]